MTFQHQRARARLPVNIEVDFVGLARRQRVFSWQACRRVSALLAVLTLAVSQADAAGTQKLTLPRLVEIAQRDNKDLQAARIAVEIGRARLVQAGQYANPRVEISRNDDSLFRNEGEYSNSIGLSQEFPIAGRILRQKDVAQVDISLAQAEIAEGERQLAREVALNFYRYVMLDRQLGVRDRLIEAEQRLVKVTQDRLRAAEVSELDVNTVRLDLQRVQQERARVTTAMGTLIATLNQQLGRPASSPLDLDTAVPEIESLAGVETLQARALELRADLRMAMLEADRAAAERALARAERWEDWAVGIGVEQDRLAIEGAPSQPSDRALMLRLTIPLPLLNRNQGAIAEADANARRAAAKISALKLEIDNEIASAHAEVSRFEEILRQYEFDTIPMSERNASLAQRGYAQGLTSIFEVTLALRQQGDSSVAYFDTFAQYFDALVRLHTAVGDYAATTRDLTPAPKDEFREN